MNLVEMVKRTEFDWDVLLNCTTSAIVVLDQEHKIVATNNIAVKLFPVESGLLGKQVNQILNFLQLERILASGSSWTEQPVVFGAAHYSLNYVPIIENKKVVGGVFSFGEEAIGNEVNAEAKDQNPNAKYDLNSIVGASEQINGLKETVKLVAPRSSNILIRGESGTGKELFAHAIHAASNRRYGPFIKVNCAAIPENLLESELFGYEEGAFTGARKGGQIGKFELAHKGTIFLDEIGDMSLPMQAKLLRVLQEREIEPLGSNKAKKVDVRIVAATNVNLEEQVRENKFREDLYYRLNVVSIQIPPLRERQDDIDVLINYLLYKYNREFGLNLNGVSPEVRELFLSYEWPGNIRELKNVIERAFNIVTGKYILLSHLPQYLVKAMEINNDKFIAVDNKNISLGVKESIGKQSLNEIMESLEQEIIQQALTISKGNKALAANLLGISRPGLYKKMLKLHMDL